MKDEGGEKTSLNNGQESSDSPSEGIEDVKEPQPVPYQYPPPYPGFPQKEKPRPWIALIAILIGIIVVFGLIFVFIIDPGGERPRVFVDLDSSLPNNLGVNVLVESGSVLSLSGSADLRITYQERVVFHSNVEIDNSGNGFVSIPYSSFVEGNGEYQFQAEYRDAVSPPLAYNVRYVVERLEIHPDVAFVEGEGELVLNIYMLEGRSPSFINPEDAFLTVNEIRRIDDGSYITAGDPTQTISESYFRNEYPYNKSGNYLINVSLENSRVNPESGSPYFIIYETWGGFLNILPVALAQITDTYPTPNSTNYTVEFDASASLNDGNITKYIWDFDGNGTIDLETTDPKVNFTGYNQSREYNALLNVEGDVIINLYLGYMEKGALQIRVSPP
jgi:hypothetical protein